MGPGAASKACDFSSFWGQPAAVLRSPIGRRLAALVSSEPDFEARASAPPSASNRGPDPEASDGLAGGRPPRAVRGASWCRLVIVNWRFHWINPAGEVCVDRPSPREAAVPIATPIPRCSLAVGAAFFAPPQPRRRRSVSGCSHNPPEIPWKAPMTRARKQQADALSGANGSEEFIDLRFKLATLAGE
jgi:hypothetical protein